MKENNNDRHHRGRRRFRHDHDVPRVVVPAQPCIVCAQPISEMASAVAYGPDQGPAHFDCVLGELAKKEPLTPGEKFAYLGSGLFGIIVEKENNRFEIHRKIPVEDTINPPAWRKELKALYKR
jgi:hypothetical protein